jgi:hypothetical protein
VVNQQLLLKQINGFNFLLLKFLCQKYFQERQGKEEGMYWKSCFTSKYSIYFSGFLCLGSYLNITSIQKLDIIIEIYPVKVHFKRKIKKCFNIKFVLYFEELHCGEKISAFLNIQ